MHRKRTFLIILAFLIFSLKSPCWAQSQAAQEAGGQERMRQMEEEDKALREKIEKEKVQPEITEQPKQEAAPIAPTQKVLIQKINITGVTLLYKFETNSLIAPYINKELNLAEMQKVADLITDAYRKKGYVTSRAYLAPQKIEGGILEITVLEGMMGSLEIKGNRYFKSNLLKEKITLQKGQPFDYNLLRKNLTKINQHPDRTARAVLAPGKDPGTTDVILEIKDRLPIHMGFDWDNFGSRYINRNRYTSRFTHNNLLGIDDKLTFQYQMGESSRYYLKSVVYTVLLPADWELGMFSTFSRVKLGQENEDADVRGKSQLYGVFANKPLIDADNLDLTLNLGFDYKNIINHQNQAVTSHDRIRVAKAGVDFDATDNFGRTIISNEVDCGIPNIMGGLDDQDINASRTGSGGKFVKDTLNLLRLQRMPLSSSLLWKNQMQLSSYILTSSEQFQIGGISNVRGYPPAEATGDRGYSSTWEWSFPPYFVPRDIKVPLSKAKFYDAFRIAMFYDWATARLRRPTNTEEKNKTLRSAGWGVRFNLPEDFSLRLDFAWPLDNTPSDSDHLHTWAQVSKSF